MTPPRLCGPGPGRAAATTDSKGRIEVLLAGSTLDVADDLREFLWCVADGVSLTRRGTLRAGDLDTFRARLAGDPGVGHDLVRASLARRRVELLLALCAAGNLVEMADDWMQLNQRGWQFLALADEEQAGFVFAAWWEGVDWERFTPRASFGRLLRRERDTLLQELAAIPPGGRVEFASFVRRFRTLVGHRWPTVVAIAGQDVWCREVWAIVIAPLAMLGALVVPGVVTTEPPEWFATTNSTDGLLQAAGSIIRDDGGAARSPATLN